MSELKYYVDKIWEYLNKASYIDLEKEERAIFDILLINETFKICKSCDRVCFKEDTNKKQCWKCEDKEEHK
jgi:hypothetical protein